VGEYLFTWKWLMNRCGSSFDLDFSKQAGKGIGV